jgi:glycosyltransferase involved in cell wall biosynthesis
VKISIITPNYNYGEYIQKTINSVLNQEYDNWEHIIVDDGSTDDSVKRVVEYQKLNKDRIILITQENRGQTAALNVALSKVTGDIICWINSDDTFCPGAFIKVISTFNQNPSADAIFGDINIIDNNGNVVRKNRYLPFKYLSAVFNGFGKEIPSNGIFWKKHLTLKAGQFDESFIYSMDAEYWSRLLINANVTKVKFCFANFRWHQSSKTIRVKNKYDKDFLRNKEELVLVFKKSYANTLIAKYLPVEYSKPLHIYFRLRRIVLRGILGEYF